MNVSISVRAAFRKGVGDIILAIPKRADKLGLDATSGAKIRTPARALLAFERLLRGSMALQAFIDDSGGSKGTHFVLAGFVSTPEKWARFSDEWTAALTEEPSINYYKNSQAMARKDQFEKWSYIDVQKKISRL